MAEQFKSRLLTVYKDILDDLDKFIDRIENEAKSFEKSHKYSEALSAIRDCIIFLAIKRSILTNVDTLSYTLAILTVVSKYRGAEIELIRSKLEKYDRIDQILKDLSPDDWKRLKELIRYMKEMEEEMKRREVNKSYA